MSPDWEIKPASAQVKKQWEQAFNLEPIIMAEERIRLQKRPLDRGQNPARTHRLRGPLATRKIAGIFHEQWQHEITSSGRIWYCLDREKRIIWVTLVSLTHPKKTS